MNFSRALEEVKQGRKIARDGQGREGLGQPGADPKVGDVVRIIDPESINHGKTGRIKRVDGNDLLVSDSGPLNWHWGSWVRKDKVEQTRNPVNG